MTDKFNMGRRSSDSSSPLVRFALSVLDFFIHSDLQGSTESLYRARVLVSIIHSFSFINATVVVLLILAKPLVAFNLAASLMIIFGLNTVYALLLLYLKRAGGYIGVCHIMVGVTLFSIVTGVVFSGGPVASPAMSLSVVPIVLAFVLAGKRIGIIWTQVALLSHAVLFVLSWNVQFPQLLTEGSLAVFHLIHWTITYGSIFALMLIFETINQRLKSQRDMERRRYRYLASHDSLTGLANRARFEEYVQKATSERSEYGNVLILMIDLDGFKPVNDSLGHEAGDQVLHTISQRFKETLRQSDFIARVGGDEFIMVAVDVENEALIEHLSNKILTLVSEPIEGIPDYLKLSASIGAAWFPYHSKDLKQLLRFADSAMYKAKAQKNSWVLYTPEEVS